MAIAAPVNSLELEPGNVRAHLLLAEIALNERDPARAQREADAALKLEPDSYAARLVLGNILLGQQYGEFNTTDPVVDGLQLNLDLDQPMLLLLMTIDGFTEATTPADAERRGALTRGLRRLVGREIAVAFPCETVDMQENMITAILSLKRVLEAYSTFVCRGCQSPVKAENMTRSASVMVRAGEIIFSPIS